MRKMWGFKSLPADLKDKQLNEGDNMVYEYVAVERKAVDGVWPATIIADGKVVSHEKDRAHLKIGALLGKKLTDDVQVIVRPF